MDRSSYGILGSSEAVADAFSLLKRASACDLPVHISGESGTGKELFAQALHKMSRRRASPFVAINCATLSGDLVGSELFGHARGAFTGAVMDRQGLFESGAGGTVFLDEIAEAKPEIQAKMLRLVDTNSVRRVGSNTDRTVDVRLVSATNGSLPELVEAGRFRLDLWQRIGALEIHLSPLRDRPDDIMPIAEHFLAQVGAQLGSSGGKKFTDGAKQKLLRAPWYGNVRELRNAVFRAVALASSDQIDAEVIVDSTGLKPEIDSWRALEIGCFRAALDRCDGNIRAAASVLDIAYSTFRARIIRMGLADFAVQQRESRRKVKHRAGGTTAAPFRWGD